MSAAAPLAIDVVSDVVCPWCFLGKRRLQRAIDAFGEPTIVRWRPYQLDPTIPKEGLDRKAYMQKKFGKDGRLAQVHERLHALGRGVGIEFAFGAIKRSPNTLDAHRLIRWAQAAGAQDIVVERLFSLYFEQGRDIGDRQLLVEVAEEAGLDRARVAEALADGRDVSEVQAEIAQAQAIGVSGVPFFIFAGRLAAPGAQDVTVLVEAMRQAGKTPRPTAVA